MIQGLENLSWEISSKKEELSALKALYDEAENVLGILENNLGTLEGIKVETKMEDEDREHYVRISVSTPSYVDIGVGIIYIEVYDFHLIQHILEEYYQNEENSLSFCLGGLSEEDFKKELLERIPKWLEIAKENSND
jgi:hypothetical protein